jgi:glutamyl/glutaminyl-tRNA synthetase
MILQEIIDAGKITNMAQTIILAQMVELFKFTSANSSGQVVDFNKFVRNTNPRYMYEVPTPKQLIDELKNLDTEDQVKLAQWCLFQLAEEQTAEQMAKYYNPSMEMTLWINYVTKAQD